MTDGWRRFPAIVLLMLFALIQGWAPLLHAHVGAGDVVSSEPDVRGIHLPDGSQLAPHRHGSEEHPAVHAECRGDEGALVTAQTEHRRDDRLAAAPVTGVPPPSHAPPEALTATCPASWFPHPSSCAARVDAAPPFPAGPPDRC